MRHFNRSFFPYIIIKHRIDIEYGQRFSSFKILQTLRSYTNDISKAFEASKLRVTDRKCHKFQKNNQNSELKKCGWFRFPRILAMEYGTNLRDVLLHVIRHFKGNQSSRGHITLAFHWHNL